METKNESRQPSTSRQPTREECRKAALICVVVGVVTTAIVIVGTHRIGRTQNGQNCEFWMYGFLQGALSDFDPDNPVVLIDIGNVSENSEDLVPIVHELVTKLKTLHKRPVAIAVDVDFSPTAALTSNTIEFFDACLKKPNSDDVPVFLGIGDNKSALPEEWLGLEKYKELAAAVAINKGDTRWIPIWVQANEGEQLKTLNYALALEYPGGLPGPPWLLSRAVEKGKEGGAVTRERGEKDPNEVTLTYGERLVNYSKLETMMRGVKTAAEAQSIDNENTSYSGKLVIIGDVTRALDNFPIPGPKDDKPGSLLLASATYTLIKEPLFEFKSKVKLGFDLFIAGIIVSLVTFLRYRNPLDSSWAGKQARFIYASIILVGIIGYLLVRFGRVIWPDFLFVLFALLLHPKVERLVHPLVDLLISLGSKLKSKLKSLRRSPPPETRAVAGAIIAVFSVTLVMAASVHAQQPMDLCERGIGAVALELKRDPKSKNKKDTCQYCDPDKDEWHALSQAEMGKKQFRPGQRLRCDKNCTLLIFVCGSGRKQPILYTEGKNRPGWYIVINPYRIPRSILDRDRFPHTPAKKMKWAYLAPTNPDPRTEALADDSAVVANLYAAETLAAEMAKTQAAVAYTSPTTDSSQSKVTAIASTTSPSAQATPTATPGVREQIARVSSPTTVPATEAATARPAGETAARVSGAETSGAEEQRKQLIEFMSLLIEGNAERDAKNYAAAETAYRKADALIPTDPRSSYGLGNVYFDQSKWTEAEQAYRKATTLSAYAPQVYLSLAMVLINSQADTGDLKRLSEAEKFLWIAARQDHRNEAVYRLLEIVLKKRGAKPDELEVAYREALQFYPASVSMNLRLAALLAPVKLKEAKKHFKIAEKAARTPEELLDVATALESRNKLDKAERFARRALKLAPGNARASLLIGLVWIDREKYSVALPWLQEAVDNNPDDFVPRYLSAIAHLQLGDLDQSERNFDEATTRVSSEEQSYATAYWFTLLADDYVQKGRKSDAVRAYEKALKHNPDDQETRLKLTKTRPTMKP